MPRMTPQQIQACFEHAARMEREAHRSRLLHWVAGACIGLLIGAALYLGF